MRSITNFSAKFSLMTAKNDNKKYLEFLRSSLRVIYMQFQTLSYHRHPMHRCQFQPDETLSALVGLCSRYNCERVKYLNVIYIQNYPENRQKEKLQFVVFKFWCISKFRPNVFSFILKRNWSSIWLRLGQNAKTRQIEMNEKLITPFMSMKKLLVRKPSADKEADIDHILSKLYDINSYYDTLWLIVYRSKPSFNLCHKCVK